MTSASSASAERIFCAQKIRFRSSREKVGAVPDCRLVASPVGPGGSPNGASSSSEGLVVRRWSVLLRIVAT